MDAPLTPPKTGAPAHGLGGGARLVGMAGLGVVVLLSGLWLGRAPLAHAALDHALKSRGVEAEFQVADLGFGHIRLEQVRLGAAAAPDLSAKSFHAGWGFGPQGFGLTAVRVDSAQLKLGLDQSGLKLGTLDKLFAGDGRPLAAAPPMELRITDSALLLDTPYGPLRAGVESDGVLGETFVGRVRASSDRTEGPGGSIEGAAAAIDISSNPADRSLMITGAGAIKALTGADHRLAGLEVTQLSGHMFGAAADTLRLSISADSADVATGEERAAATELSGQLELKRAAPGKNQWQIATTLNAARIARGDLALNGAQLTLSAPQAGGDRFDAQMSLAGDWAGQTLRRGRLTLTAPMEARSGAKGFALTATQGQLEIRSGALGGKAAALLDQAVPKLDGFPVGPLLTAGKQDLAAFAQDFTLQAPFSFSWAEGAGALSLPQGARLAAGYGATVIVTPPNGQPAATFDLATNALALGGRIVMAGADLPALTLNITPGASVSAKRTLVEGTVALAPWEKAGARATLPEAPFVLDLTDGAGALRLSGELTASGPFGGFQVSDMKAPLDLAVAIGANGGWRLAPRQGCPLITMEALSGPAAKFGRTDARLCPDASGAFMAVNAGGALSGGFQIDQMTLRGETVGRKPAPLTVAWADVRGGLSGTLQNTVIAGAVTAPRFSLLMSPTRSIDTEATTLTFTATAGGGTWGAQGRFMNAVMRDPTIPANLTNIQGAWRANPTRDKDVIITLAETVALVTDKEPRPRFTPLKLADLGGVLDDGVFKATGAIQLDANGAPLAAFEGQHNLSTGAGDAKVLVRGLEFGPRLELFQVSELARGVVENVAGAVEADFLAKWQDEDMKLTGAVTLQNIAATTAGLGQVDGVNGTIQFDDLTQLTTPPGQTLTIAAINPGVPVENGAVKFQMQPQGAVQLEDARFPFAGGVISVDPVKVEIGAEQSRYTLRVTDLDIGAFLKQQGFDKLNGEGKVSGVLPLVITPLKASIEKGLLESPACPDLNVCGGVILYSGEPPPNAGAGALAFDALRAFRFDQLRLEVSGPLDGDLETTILFSGRNEAAIRPVQGVEQVFAKRVPFKFNVTVRAPFQQLMRSAKTVTDPMELLRARGLAPPVTPPPPPPPPAPGS
jgi:hypothetical protein